MPICNCNSVVKFTFPTHTHQMIPSPVNAIIKIQHAGTAHALRRHFHKM
jgi:hypothetical protein